MYVMYIHMYAPQKSEHHCAPVRACLNVVVFILESFGREYWGAMNYSRKIENFESFTPFLDSLAQHSLVFSNGFTNSRKSIHGMPAVLAGIPSFDVSYTSSQYSNQSLQSLVSIAEEMEYSTSFFHGAPNGSMGFLGFSQVLGFDKYYGKNEYDNNADYDGIWGIWDEPFFQFTQDKLSEDTSPFLATIFSVSSHAPFKIPQKYEGEFKEGYVAMHPCVQYTDYAIARFIESSKKEPWFENTIFVFTADHANLSYFEFYQKSINRFAISSSVIPISLFIVLISIIHSWATLPFFPLYKIGKESFNLCAI